MIAAFDMLSDESIDDQIGDIFQNKALFLENDEEDGNTLRIVLGYKSDTSQPNKITPDNICSFFLENSIDIYWEFDKDKPMEVVEAGLLYLAYTSKGTEYQNFKKQLDIEEVQKLQEFKYDKKKAQNSFIAKIDIDSQK